MPDRDAHAVPLSRQAVVVVTGVGVGLLTLAFVLGVQVGKQTAALRAPQPRSAGEHLAELPAPLKDQLKALEGREPAAKPELRRPEPAPAAAPAPAPAAEQSWTLQLVSTSDAAEAKRVADRARAAGFPATTLTERGQHKVRLARNGPRAEIDALAAKLQAKGLKSFPVKVD